MRAGEAALNHIGTCRFQAAHQGLPISLTLAHDAGHNDFVGELFLQTYNPLLDHVDMMLGNEVYVLEGDKALPSIVKAGHHRISEVDHFCFYGSCLEDGPGPT